MTTAIASAGQPLVNSYCATGARDDETVLAGRDLVERLAQQMPLAVVQCGDPLAHRGVATAP